MEDWFTPCQPCQLPEIHRALVLAPHPDDEIFGCGGTLAFLKERQADIHVHVLTDGAGWSAQEQRRELSEIRRLETDSALSVLGIESASHAGFLDRRLASEIGLAQHVRSLLDKHRPQLIFAPSLWEIHPDHLAVARAICAALDMWHGGEGQDISVMFYEIGAPQRCNCLIDVTPVWEKKHRAMTCFTSQLEQQDYIRHISALNEYRSYTLPAQVKYAEAFTCLTVEQICNVHPQGGGLVQQLKGLWIEAALSVADAQCESLQSRLVTSERELNKAMIALGEAIARAEMADANARIAEQACRSEKLALAEVLASTSWRITSPLRWLVNALRR